MRVSQIIKQTFSENVRADTKREGSIEGRHELVLPSLQTSALRCRQNALKPGTQGPRRSPKQRWHKNEQRTQYISVYREELWAHGIDACSLPGESARQSKVEKHNQKAPDWKYENRVFTSNPRRSPGKSRVARCGEAFSSSQKITQLLSVLGKLARLAESTYIRNVTTGECLSPPPVGIRLTLSPRVLAFR